MIQTTVSGGPALNIRVWGGPALSITVAGGPDVEVPTLNTTGYDPSCEIPVGNAFRGRISIRDPDTGLPVDPDALTATLVNRTTRATTSIAATKLSVGEYEAFGVPTSADSWFIHFSGTTAFPIQRDVPFEAIAGL